MDDLFPKRTSSYTQKECERLLEEVNTLRFRCDCGHIFEMKQPKGKWVRYNSKTNFFIPAKDEHGVHTPIHCPRCNRTNGIRRLVKTRTLVFNRTGNRERSTLEMDLDGL